MPVATLKPGPNDHGPVYSHPGNKMTASLVIIRKETRYDGGIMKNSIGRSDGLVNAMNHELGLRERWRRIVEAALEYEEEKLAEATIVLTELTPKTPVFKQPNGHD